jgi:low temperature requirement protein LtrA
VIGYALLLAVLVALFVRAHRRFPQARALTGRYAVGARAVARVARLRAGGAAVDLGRAMLVLLVTPVIAVRAVEDEPYDTWHSPERYGLFTLIVLGESIVFTVEGLETGTDLPAALAAILGFVLAACVWWVYFGRVKPIPGRERPLGAFVWGYGHLLIFAGIAPTAAGLEFAVEAEAGDGRVELAERITLGGGLAAYLAAMAAIHAVTVGIDRVAGARVLAATAILAVALFGGSLAPLPFVGAVTALAVGVAAWEGVRARPRGERRPAEAGRPPASALPRCGAFRAPIANPPTRTEARVAPPTRSPRRRGGRHTRPRVDRSLLPPPRGPPRS